MPIIVTPSIPNASGAVPVTAGDQINGALRLIGKLAEGEIPSPETSADCLMAMNQMIDSWSAERLSVFSTQDQVFSWPASTRSRTLGPTGDFVGNRPVEMDDSTYFLDASTGVSYGIKLISQAQYDGLAVKTVTSTYAQILFINYEMPNITMFQYPVANKAIEWHFISVTELTEPALLSTTLVVPPGYKRAFRFNLACEIAAEFGIEPPPTVARIAMASKRNIKRINSPMDQMAMPYSIMQRRPRFNVYSGSF